MITSATTLLKIHVDSDETECVECGDWLMEEEAVYCSCGWPMCEDCYEEYEHHTHDTSPENGWLRSMIRDGTKE